MNYYISDLHFGCKNSFENRTLEHDNIIKQNWNNIVTNGDTVYILGDIGKCGSNADTEYLCKIISTLKGKKILIKGNHDVLKDIRLTQLFTEICDYKEITDNFGGKNHKLVLSHYPIFSWNGAYKDTILLYGHTHGNFDDMLFQESLDKLRNVIKELNNKDEVTMKFKKEPYAYNVGCMLYNYEPVTLERILKDRF